MLRLPIPHSLPATNDPRRPGQSPPARGQRSSIFSCRKVVRRPHHSPLQAAMDGAHAQRAARASSTMPGRATEALGIAMISSSAPHGFRDGRGREYRQHRQARSMPRVLADHRRGSPPVSLPLPGEPMSHRPPCTTSPAPRSTPAACVANPWEEVYGVASCHVQHPRQRAGAGRSTIASSQQRAGLKLHAVIDYL